MENLSRAKKESYLINGIIWLFVIPLVVDQNRKISIVSEKYFLLFISFLCTVYFSWAFSFGIRYGFTFVRGATLAKKENKGFFYLQQFIWAALLLFFAIVFIKQIYVATF